MATSRIDPLPEPDLCAQGATTGATRLELGGDNDNQFEVLAEDDVVRIVEGGQGTDMLPLRFRAVGTSAECISVSVAVYRCADGTRCVGSDPETTFMANVTHSLAAYPDGDAMATLTNFVVLDTFTLAGQRFLIEARAAGAMQSLYVWVDAAGKEQPDAGEELFDAGVDGVAPDATAPDGG